MNHLLLTWIIAIVVLCLVWRVLVKGWFYGFLYALGHVIGIAADVSCQIWIDVTGVARRKKKSVKLDEYEKKIS